MKAHITGVRDGQPWPLAGGVIDLPDAEAEALVGAGLARPAEEVPATAVLEVATMQDPETPEPRRQGRRKAAG